MHEDRDEALIQAVLASGIHIPPMPDILSHLQRLLGDERAGPYEIARLIERDGALSGAVYRLAGSPVFGTRLPVTRIEQAVALLGLRNTAVLIRNETLRTALRDPAHANALEALWTRTGAIAELMLCAHRQGRLRGLSQDDAFTLGLFHDCGLALLIKRFPDYAHALASGTWPDIGALDRANQTHHGLVGQMVARNWQLGTDIVAAIRHHHELDASGLPDSVARLCALLNSPCTCITGRMASPTTIGRPAGAWNAASAWASTMPNWRSGKWRRKRWAALEPHTQAGNQRCGSMPQSSYSS